MVELLDSRKLSTEQRLQVADRLRVARDFNLPVLDYLNARPCSEHDDITQGCRHCGFRFRRHQRVGVTWLYFRQRALLADSVGTGKTLQAAGVIAYAKQTGELDELGRVLVCCRAPAVLQWQSELRRAVPRIPAEVAIGTRAQRIERYVNPWQILIISPQTLLNDYEMILRFPISTLVVDDVDSLRNRDTQTAYVLKRIGRETQRFLFMSGTPLQKKLDDLHSVLEPLGGDEVFGDERSFKRRYVREEPVTIYNRKNGRKITKMETVGYKNMEEFRTKVAPFVLRRTAGDIEDVDLPTIIPSNVPLELYPAQKARYEQLRQTAKQLLSRGQRIDQTTASASIHAGSKICTGLSVLGEQDGPGTSVKFDWVMEQVGEDGDFEEEKVVIFAGYKDAVRALQGRLGRAGIGHVTIWGEDQNKIHRQQSMQRFWEDPGCRVLIGTQAIEQSLNLQCARHLININMILNPSRMIQLAGRIRRDGSAFKNVYVHNLIAVNTQEERIIPLLEREQALVDYVWDDSDELFEKLSPSALMHLITG